MFLCFLVESLLFISHLIALSKKCRPLCLCVFPLVLQVKEYCYTAGMACCVFPLVLEVKEYCYTAGMACCVFPLVLQVKEYCYTAGMACCSFVRSFVRSVITKMKGDERGIISCMCCG